MTINVEKLEKNGKKCQKYAKFCDAKILQDVPFKSRNYSVTYLQTLEEVPWLLRLKKSKKRQETSKKP